MRLFLAVHFPASLERDIRRASDALRTRLGADCGTLRWVEPSQFHITVKFLDECTNEDADILARELKAPLQRMAPFPLRLGHCGYFPPHGEPRVLQVAIEDGGAELAMLAAATDDVAHDTLGRPRDERMFHPHVTLARIKSVRNRSRFTDLLDTTPPVNFPPCVIATIELVRSRLNAQGARYETIGRFELGPSLAERPGTSA